MAITGHATGNGCSTCRTIISKPERRGAAGEVEIAILIKNARLWQSNEPTDVRVNGTHIAAIAAGLVRGAGDALIDAAGATLLPGLHDHHIHLMALAAARDSLRCGPPDIHSRKELETLLGRHNASVDRGWLRGIGYHPCVAGDIDRNWLDRHIPDRPVRIQHRGGRLWVLNSRALQALGTPGGDSGAELERVDGRATGRLYEGDRWLRARLQSTPPPLGETSRMLAGYGVTGLTDTSPANGVAEWQYFDQCQRSGQLLQRVRMMGSPQLPACRDTESLERGEFKVHLLESRLPDPDALSREMAAAHSAGRAVAVHCVTLTELVFALSALQAAGVRRGDRIEHASVTPPDLLPALHELGLRVVTQPHFIAERGDQYYSDVAPEELPWLYRGAAFIAAGIPLAAGSDAPFGDADPWRAMRAAVQRTTGTGRVMAPAERLTPEQALALFLSPAATPGLNHLRLAVGARADLCLLDAPWEQVRHDLHSGHVRATWRAGQQIHGSG